MVTSLASKLPSTCARLVTPNKALTALEAEEKRHPLWSCKLMYALENQALQLSDLRLVFEQYYFYSRSFTRFVAAVMANCDCDFFRALLTENLWDECGGIDLARRHSQIFRTFLEEGIQVNPEQAVCADYTRQFINQYLTACAQADALGGSAFLSLGSEAIVPRIYQIFVQALLRAGVPQDKLEFFYLHIAGDDAHALTLKKLMLSLMERPGGYETCRAAMHTALDLRLAFFDRVYEAIQQARVGPTIARIQAGTSLATKGQVDALRYASGDPAPTLYQNVNQDLGIDFAVQRLPLPTEVLDPRMVRVAPGKRNENHRHAHETMMYFISGHGRVRVDGQDLEVGVGDVVMVPRWAQHQTTNLLSDQELIFLAVTDARLTEKAFLGDSVTSYRLGPLAQ